nr:MAG TPA: hypothetical protein [Caudoviricetes sp.]
MFEKLNMSILLESVHWQKICTTDIKEYMVDLF